MHADLFVDPAWWAVLYDTYGFSVSVSSVADATGAVRSMLPFVDIDDLTGSRTVSLPFCDFVDVPATDDDWPTLVDPLLATGRTLRLDTPADHPATRDPRITSAIDAVHHTITVDRCPTELAQGYGELTRRMVRKAERAGIRYRLATEIDAMWEYHRLHVDVRKNRHGLLAQPFAMFESIHEHFVKHGRGGVIVGELDGEVVGGCVVLVTDTAVHYKFSASHPDHRRNGVSHGAVHAALHYTHELGLDCFDFGRSDLAHDGLVSFKRRFAPQERLLASHRAGPDVDRSVLARLHELTRVYVDPATPDELTRLGGDHLYRYFA